MQQVASTFIIMSVENKQRWVLQSSTSCCLHKTIMLDECLEIAALFKLSNMACQQSSHLSLLMKLPHAADPLLELLCSAVRLINSAFPSCGMQARGSVMCLMAKGIKCSQEDKDCRV